MFKTISNKSNELTAQEPFKLIFEPTQLLENQIKGIGYLSYSSSRAPGRNHKQIAFFQEKSHFSRK